jgi:hypothetical protein
VRQVVVEVRAAGHLTDQRGELGLGVEIRGNAPRIEQAVIPVIRLHELAEVERVARECREHRSGTARFVYPKCLTIAAPANLEIAVAANVRVMVGVQWEQHSDSPVRLGVEDEQIPIHFGTRIHADAITTPDMALLVQPHLDRCLDLGVECRRGGRRERQRRKE